MAMPRFELPMPDYMGTVRRGLDTAAGVERGYRDREEAKRLEGKADARYNAQQAELNAPANPVIMKAIKYLTSGMSPQEAATRAKVDAHLESQPQPPAMPGPMPGAQPSPGSMPSMAPGPWRAGYDMGPMSAPLEEEIVVRGSLPQQPPPQLPEPDISLRNRDVPMTLQALNSVRKDSASDLSNALGWARLSESQRQFMLNEDDREARRLMVEANRANIPFKNQMQMGNLAQRTRSNDIAGGNLQTRRDENYLRGTNETAWAVPGLRKIIADLKVAGIAPSEFDYATRKAATIAAELPGWSPGKALAGGLEYIADAMLTPEQRQARNQIALAINPYRKLTVGTQITAGEKSLIDQIAGQQLSVRDSIASLMALENLMAARQGRYEAAYPDSRARIPSPTPQQALPPITPPYPTGFGNEAPPLEPLPEGPSLEEEMRRGLFGGDR